MTTPIRGLNRTCRFEHTGHYGTRLEAKSMDLLTENVLYRPLGITDAQFAADVAQIIGWWAENIKPAFLLDGSGWPGYDCIKYQIKPID